MPNARTPALAVLVLLTGGLAACGNGSSAGPGSDAPDDASRSAFCASLARLTGAASPWRTADALARVGTPSDIGSTARHGFEVLVSRLHDLPQDASAGTITQMTSHLEGAELQEVAAFVAYYVRECPRQPKG